MDRRTVGRTNVSLYPHLHNKQLIAVISIIASFGGSSSSSSSGCVVAYTCFFCHSSEHMHISTCTRSNRSTTRLNGNMDGERKRFRNPQSMVAGNINILVLPPPPPSATPQSPSSYGNTDTHTYEFMHVYTHFVKYFNVQHFAMKIKLMFSYE